MIHLTARALMALLPTLDITPELRDLLRRRLDALRTRDGDLTDWTEYLIVHAGDTEDDVVRHLGFSPLVDPIDGARWGEPGFHPGWNLIHDHGGWFEIVTTFGSTFAYIIFVEDDAPGAWLAAVCRAEVEP